MSDDTSQSLVDESHFPLQNPFLGNINYDQLIHGEILELLGVKDASDEERQKMYATMLSTIENRVLSRLADLLTDDELDKMAELNDKEEIDQFFTSKNIDVAHIFADEAIRYKTELVSLVNRHG